MNELSKEYIYEEEVASGKNNKYSKETKANERQELWG